MSSCNNDMRRSMRRAVLNAVLFLSALCIILYLGRAPSDDKNFAWTTIRYKSTARNLPEPRGTCPGLGDTSKPALVVARVTQDGDTSWLDSLQDQYHICIYTADAPTDKTSTTLQVPANRGHEAMAYLTFLIDNYDSIPEDGVVLVHGSRFAWHNDQPVYDNKELLALLNVTAALEPYGYHNLRCDWSASTCPESEKAQGSWETASRAILEPHNQRVVSDAALPRALATLFDGDEADAAAMLGRRDAVRSQCCAQFAVSRKAVHRHLREEYFAVRQWLLDGKQENFETAGQAPIQNWNAAPPDDRIAGRVLSYVWHILFLPHGGSEVNLSQLNKRACPSAQECYCRLYGRCNLPDCRRERCRGQYRVPPHFRLPVDWAKTHA